MPQDPQTLFKQKSRSFSLAARLLSPETRQAIALLYQFCRTVDDLADSSLEGQARQLQALGEALSPGSPAGKDPAITDFLKMAQRRKLPLQAARELVAASEADCGPRRIESEAELIRFAYGVAGTVGLLMQPLLGAEDPRATPFAIDLGIGLQLTNIARDVAEDAGRERFYLPADWVQPETIRRALREGEPGAVAQVDLAVEKVLHLADRYYTSALAGHWFIPARNRRAIFFALSFYRAIGRKMRRRGSAAWQKRTRIGLLSKLAIGIKAYPRYRALQKQDWTSAQPPQHEHSLHDPLSENRP